MNFPLIIVGEGPEKKDLQKIANKNIKFLGFQKDFEIKKLMENCRAFLYAGIEDFGIAPVEAMAAGAPIIAYGKAGILDTVNCITSNSKNPTGIIYQGSISRCIKRMCSVF